MISSMFSDHIQSYMNYFTGEKSGESVIGREEENLALEGQAHSLRNTLSALIKSPLQGLGLTLAGAYYTANAFEAPTSIEEMLSKCNSIIKTPYALFTAEQHFEQCTLTNWTISTVDLISEHPYILSASVLALTALLMCSNKESAERNEKKAKLDLIDRLESKINLVATKLQNDYRSSEQTNQENLKGIAEKIISNKKNIKEDLRGLNIFSKEEIKALISPVINASKLIIRENAQEVAK